MDIFSRSHLFETVEKELERIFISENSIKNFIKELENIDAPEAHHLLHLCKERLLDCEIDRVTDGAQGASESDVARLRDAIEKIVSRHALSMENRQMLLLARRLLQKIAPDGVEWGVPKDDEWGAIALEIAYLLYRGEVGKAKILLNSFPVEIGSLSDSFTVEWAMICRLIGYATGEPPSRKGAEALFRDLEASIAGVAKAE